MPLFILKNHYGFAIVGAENKEKALQAIKTHEDHEHNGAFMSLGVKAESLVQVSQDAQGMIAYQRND